MKLVPTLALGLMFAMSAIAGTETVTNLSVIELQKAGLADDLIAEKIRSSAREFDLSTEGLKQLKAGGVSDGVIRVMMGLATSSSEPAKPLTASPVSSDNPLDVHAPGLWLYEQENDQAKMTKLGAKDVGRSSGWNKKTRATLYGASAILQIRGPRPVFYYYGPDETIETTVTDLVLTRMEARADKNDRRLAVGKEDFFGGKKSGLDPKTYVAVQAEKVAPGIYKIVPAQDLVRGEYSFIRASAASREALKRGDIDLFDFGVK